VKISFTGPAMRFMDRGAGYGEASYNIIKSFKELGVEVELEASSADIEICFADPGNYVFYDSSSYKIGYSAWESTEMTSDFKKTISYCDEIWGTSPWTTSVFKSMFPGKPTLTYKHGIHQAWKPKLRKEPNQPFTFLHIGEPYSRKDAQMVVDSFVELFGNNPRFRLVLKCTKMNTTRVKHPRGGWTCSPSALYDNIVEITGMLSEEQMIALYDQSDVFIYPSWGEGFGFQPLQALAMGMPTICVDGWADYAKYITWPVESNWEQSPWTDKHPGLMMRPNKNMLKAQMQESVSNYKEVLQDTFKNAFDIHREYDWLEVTKPAVARLKEIYANLLLEREYFNLSELKKRT
jgi:glycosyltransferase involved in cell wall biosynthesis